MQSLCIIHISHYVVMTMLKVPLNVVYHFAVLKGAPIPISGHALAHASWDDAVLSVTKKAGHGVSGLSSTVDDWGRWC